MPSWELVEPENPILMLLEGNGSLLGRDRDGSFSATGSGALRYAPAEGARQNLLGNTGLVADDTGWAATFGAGRVADADFASGWAYEITEDTLNDGGLLNYHGVIPQGGDLTLSCAVKWISGEQDEWYAYGAHFGVGNTGGLLDFSPYLDGEVHRVSTNSDEWPNLNNFFQFALLFQRGGNAPSGTSTIRVGDVVLERGIIDDPQWFDDSVCIDPSTGQLNSAHGVGAVERAVFWIEEATTNLILNPSFEVDTSGWAVGVNLSLSRVTTQAKFGSACGEIEFLSDSSDALYVSGGGNVAPFSEGEPLTVSLDVSTMDVSFVVIDVVWLTAAFAVVSVSASDPIVLSADGSWEHLEWYMGTAPATTAYAQFRLGIPGLTGEIIRIDGIQLEKKAYATSYCDGSLGTGYAWAGVAHASASTRAGTSVDLSSVDRVSTELGSVVARWKPVAADQRRVVEIGRYGSDPVAIQMLSGPSSLWVDDYQSGASSNELVSGLCAAYAWRFGAVGWDDTQLYASMDAEPFVAGARVGDGSAGVSAAHPLIAISGYTGAFGDLGHNGFTGPVAIYDRLLTDAELLDVNDTIAFDEDLWDVLEPPPDVGGPTSGGPMFSYGFSARPSAGVGVIDRRKKKRHVSLDVIMHPDDERVRRS